MNTLIFTPEDFIKKCKLESSRINRIDNVLRISLPDDSVLMLEFCNDGRGILSKYNGKKFSTTVEAINSILIDGYSYFDLVIAPYRKQVYGAKK